MTRTPQPTPRSSILRPIVTSLRALGLLLALPTIAAAQEAPGQNGALWDLGSQRQGGVFSTTLTAVNLSCPGRRSFDISIEGQATEFLRLDGPSRIDRLKRGESRSVPAVVDLTGLAPGRYDDGGVEIRCVDCSPSCQQDVQRLRIRLNVLPAEPTTSGDRGSSGETTEGDSEPPRPRETIRRPGDGDGRPHAEGVPIAGGGCVQRPAALAITDWDLIGDLARNHALGRSPGTSCDLNDIREDLGLDLAHVEKTLADLDRVIEAYGGLEKYGVHCEAEELQQSFPPFPNESFFLDVDLCQVEGEHQLVDFVSPNADPAALDRWCQDFRRAFANFGVSNPNARTLATAYQQAIQRSIQKIAAAGARFKSQMEVTLALRYSTTKGWNKFVDFLVTAALSAGGGPVAWCTAVGQTLLTEAARTASGGDPKAVMGAQILGSIASLGIGSLTGAAEAGFAGALQQELLTGAGLEGVGDIMTSALKSETADVAFSMGMLDDATWNNTMAKYRKEGYFSGAFDQFASHREELKAEVVAALRELCAVRAALRALLPGLKAAHAEAVRRLESRSWRQVFQDQELGCTCCRYADGSGPDGDCRFTIPRF